jgi:hypothetical protein
MPSTRNDPAYRTAEYRRNRLAVLADHPACSIRGPLCTGVATTADHIVSVTRGGDNSLTNLRPACGPCNSSRGDRDPTSVTRNAARARNAKRFLDPAADQSPPIHFAISPKNPGGRNGSGGLVAAIPKRGRLEPRLSTPAHGVGTFGPDVTRWARRNMPFKPMAWNALAFDRLLATDRAGRLVHRQGLVSVARQNSKTTAFEALVGYWLTDRADAVGPQTVGWMSHDLKLTERAFAFLSRLLEARTAAVSFSFGRQRLELDNGSQLVVLSNSVNAGHGWSFDLVVADESWRIKPEALNEGVIPAMRARPQPLLLMASTAGDDESVVLRQWRERGLAIIEEGRPSTLCMLEWSPPPAVDWSDPQWWAWANPCLGVTLTRETLAAEYDGPDRRAFLRASLNIWTSAAQGWLPAGQWDRCLTRSLPVPAGGVIAAEVAQGGDRFYAVRAWLHNGICYVVPAVVTEYEDVLWAELDRVYGDVDQVAISPTLQPHLPPGLNRKTSLVGMKELARSVPLVRSMIAAGNVAHPSSTLLDEHVGRAVATMSAGLSTAHSSGSIELARCLVWAVAMASRPQYNRRPAVAAAR